MGDPQLLIPEQLAENTAAGRPPLSVAFVSPGWPPGAIANGVIPYIDKVAKALRKQGHQATVLAHYVNGEVDETQIRDLRPGSVAKNPLNRMVDQLAFKRSVKLGLRRQSVRTVVENCRWLIKNQGLQLLELEEIFGLAYWVRKKLPIPIVVRLHGPQFINGSYLPKEHPDVKAYIRDEGKAIAEADLITSPSLDTLERTRAYYGLELKGALVFPPPTDMVPEADRWSCHGSDPNLILFVGRFDLHKGGDLIIKAFAEVARRKPEAHLKFVGDDSGVMDQDGNRVGIEEYIRREAPDFAGRINFLGRLHNRELSKLRRGARVTVVCSRYETFGLTLSEAITHGCPIVATRIGAFPELLQDGINGLLCVPENPIDLANKISLLLEDEDLATRLGRQAALDGASRYEADTIAGELSEHFRRLIETHGRAGRGGSLR